MKSVRIREDPKLEGILVHIFKARTKKTQAVQQLRIDSKVAHLGKNK